MKKSLVIILLLLSNMSFSQTLYNKLYLDGITAESIITMDAAVTSDGGSVAVGLIESGGIDQSLVVKLDANGDTSWVRRANDAISSYYSSVEVNSAGEIVVGGSTGVTESDATLTKYDNSGNLIWANKLELQGAFGEYLNAYLNFEPVEKPQISVDGTDVILATNSKDGMFDSTRVHVAKVNSAGSLVWTTTFNFMDGLMAPYYDVDEGSLSGVEVLSNGNIALCGGFIDRFTVKYSWVVLLDPNGNYIDEKVIVTSGGSSWIKFYDLIEMPNGDILLAGTGLNVPGSSNYGMLLSRFDASLNYISTNHYNTSGTCKEIEHAPSGGYYAIVEGMDLAFDGSNRNGVVKLDASLNVEWAKMYGSSNSDYANAVDVFPNGDIMIVGRSAGFTAGGSFKAYMVRADSDGFVPGCWVETVNFTNDTITLSISNLTESVGVSGAFSPIGGADFPIELEISDINIDFSGVSTEPLCTGEQGGVDVIIASINSPYTFQWSNGTSSADITDFSGDYNVLIRDAYGCVETDTFSIVDPTALSASYATSDVTCFGFGNGSINLTPTGGTPGYTYDWSTLANAEDLSNLGGGFYQCEISDANGCTKIVGISVSEPQQLTAVITATINASCESDCDGQLAGFAAGGTAPYTYLWNDPSAQNNDTAIGLCFGNYLFTVEDANGCFSYSNASISEPNTLTNTNTIWPSDCFASNGSVMADPNGGTSPFMYDWNGTGSLTNDSIGGLDVGNGTVQITDANGCSLNEDFIIGSNTSLNEICVVTVDTNNQNLIVWQKPIVTNIAGFKIYRNIAGVYAQVGYQPYDSISQYVDNDFGVDPQVTSYRYKIGVLDSCGNESALSNFHETIHLTASLGLGSVVNLIWDDYEGISFSNYDIWRDTTGNGDWEIIATVPSTNFTFTDNTVPASSTTLRYAIEVVLLSTCTAEKSQDHNTTRSNRHTIMAPNDTGTSIEELLLSEVKVYPNPTKTSVNIQINADNWTYQLFDLSGREIQSSYVNETIQILSLESLESGVYALRISIGNSFVMKKVIKE